MRHRGFAAGAAAAVALAGVLVPDGAIWLDLDDGEMIRLGPGDTVIQNATRHAWRNVGDAPATLAVVHVGVTR